MNVRLLLNTVLLCVLPALSQYQVDVVPGPFGIFSMQAIGDSLYLNCKSIEGQGSLAIVKNGMHKIVHAGISCIGCSSEFTVFNAAVYYCLNDSSNDPYANALWKTDGISVATKAVAARVGEPVVVDGFMYFRKYDPLSGHELWKFDGVNTEMVADMVPGTVDFYPAHITVFNKKLYFMADHPEYGFELWTSDGTKAGTYLLKDIWRGTKGSDRTTANTFKLTEYNNRFYFLANDSIHGVELWHSDGTSAGTTLLKDILPGEASAFNNSFLATPLLCCVFNNELYFVPDASVNGKELWKTDGTTSGTVMLKDINPGPCGSDITELQVSNGYLYFNAFDGVHGKELWRTDGTSEGTVMVLDLQPQIPGETSSNPKDLACHIDGKLYFICKESVEDSSCCEVKDGSLLVTISLYRTDGTVGGTEKIYSFPAGEDLDSNHMITSTNNGLYFRSVNGNHNYLLWLHDSTLSNNNTTVSSVTKSFTAQRSTTAVGVSMKVYSYEEQGNNYCQSNPRIRVVNTGSVPVSNFKVEYYFMIENGKTPILAKYYTGDCFVSLVSTGGPNYKIVYDYTGKTIQPGQSLPDLAGSVVGLHYPDYSPFDKTNDYSNNLSTAFSENNHICIYSQSNSLIYGIPPNSNRPPVAIAPDPDTIIDVAGDGEYVLLDGSHSYDPDGTIVSYEWYNGNTLISYGETAYVTLFDGVHNFILKVTDDKGATAIDTTTITIVLPAINHPPVAIAPDPDTIIDAEGDGEYVMLDGSRSYDPDGTIVSYEWYSGNTLIASGDAVSVTLFDGVHNTILKVVDNKGATAFDTTTITIVLPAINRPPVAIGPDPDSLIDVAGDGERVVLDGSRSYDPDGTIVLYEWFNGNTLIAYGKTVYLTLYHGEHSVILKVTDDKGASAFDTTTFKIVDPSDKVKFYLRTYWVRDGDDVLIEYYVPPKLDGAVIRYSAQRDPGRGGPEIGTLDGTKGDHMVRFSHWTWLYFDGPGPWPITFEVNGVVTDTLQFSFYRPQ